MERGGGEQRARTSLLPFLSKVHNICVNSAGVTRTRERGEGGEGGRLQADASLLLRQI